TARCFRHFVAIAVSKPQPESRALADWRRTLRLQAVVFSFMDPRPLKVIRATAGIKDSWSTII
ncbi:MAG: hypothetical protein ABGX16_15710, partial [Pirellulales bacterium]